MNFIIDAHLPQRLRDVFRRAGNDAIHTLDLPERNSSRDGALNEITISEERLVVTKDTDFYYSHLLQNQPWKLVRVRTGSIGLKEKRQMFEDHQRAIAEALQTYCLVELDQQNVLTQSGLSGSPPNKKQQGTGQMKSMYAHGRFGRLFLGFRAPRGTRAQSAETGREEILC